MTEKNHGRLAAIDVLRGFDMFFLVGAGDVLRRTFKACGFGSDSFVISQLGHADWIGFTAWDIIMPLFLFTSGLSMPFSLGKYEQTHSRAGMYGKIFKRFGLLFLLGWIAQGNLLDLNPGTFHVYCNTLHAIAFGYLITAFTVLNIKNLKWQIVAGVSMLAVYWLALTVFGDFTPSGNAAIAVDHAVFGRFDDGTQYTWLLTSLSFGATVMTGYFAGLIMKADVDGLLKIKRLAAIGALMIVAGLLISLQLPVIKKIWSPSMLMLSSGICFLLLALSSLLTDRLRLDGWWVRGLRIFGLNSIAAYMLHTTFGLDRISRLLLHGFEQYVGDFFPALVSLGEFGILWFILWQMYRHKVFIKV